jgi:phage tail sheath protein FI
MARPPSLLSPGVYVSEVPAHAEIAASSTSLTAFIGRARWGPVDEPVVCASFADFEAQFGGLWEESLLGHAVRDFFLNGGGQALIVRIFVDADAVRAVQEGDPGFLPEPVSVSEVGADVDGVASVRLGVLPLRAASPGSWGNEVVASIDRLGIDATGGTYGLAAADLFNLTLTAGSRRERLLDVTVDPEGGSQRLDRALMRSALARAGELPSPEAMRALLAAGASVEVAMTGGGDGARLTAPSMYVAGPGRGLYALDRVACFNLLVVPRDRWGAEAALPYAEVFAYVVKRGAFWILEAPPTAWDEAARTGVGLDGLITATYGAALQARRNAAVYYPDVIMEDPLQPGVRRAFGPAGAIAGVYAYTDATRGVWKAPAGVEAGIEGAFDLHARLDDQANGALNGVGINCLRVFPSAGCVIWGARTLAGADAFDDDARYVPVRRLLLFLEASLQQGLRWTVFEPNDASLWGRVEEQATHFLQDLWRQGALVGSTSKEAFFARCDTTTTTQAEIEAGRCVLVVGVAPVHPAEFILLTQELPAASA